MEAFRQSGGSLLARVRFFFIPMMLLMGSSVCLQLAGCVSPGWIIVNSSLYKVHIGLWIVKYCVFGECQAKPIEEIDPYGIVSQRLTEYRVETVLGLLFISSAILAAGFSRHPGRAQVTVFSFIILSLISGILALIASCKVADDTRKTNDMWKNQGMVSLYKFPYSVFLTCLGGVLACIASLGGLCCIKPCINASEPQSAYQLSHGPAQQFSAHAVPQPTMTQTSATQPYLAQPYLAQTYPAQQHPVQQYPVPPYAAQPHLDYSLQGAPAKPGSVDDTSDNSHDIGNFGSDLEPIVPRI